MGKGSKNKKVRKAGVSGNPAIRAAMSPPPRKSSSTITVPASASRSVGSSSHLMETVRSISLMDDSLLIGNIWDDVAMTALNSGQKEVVSALGTALLNNPATALETLLEAEHLLDTGDPKRSFGTLLDRRFDLGDPAPLLGKDWHPNPASLNFYVKRLAGAVAASRSEARLAAMWPFCANLISTYAPPNAAELYDAFANNEHADGGVLADVLLSRP